MTREDKAPQSRDRIRVMRVLHTIHAVRDLAPVRKRYQDLLGGIVFAERYHSGEDRDMALLYVANHMVEPMAPRRPDDLDTTFSRYLDKYGDSLHSFELRVASAPETAERCRSFGLELSTVYPLFFFVKPRSTGGVVVQICGKPLVNDPYDYRNWNPDWAQGHPSTLRRLAYIACVTRDMAASLRFFTEVLDGEVVGEDAGGDGQTLRQVFVRLGDTIMGLLDPGDSSTSPLKAYLARPHSGVYAIVWQVDDVAAARKHLESVEAVVERATLSPDGIAIAPASMFGARHEFIPGKDWMFGRESR